MEITLLVTLLCCSVSIYAGQVPPPENVRIVSENMGLILKWDAPQQSTASNFRYTAECLAWQSFEEVCKNTSSLSCDFTNIFSIFGTYVVRVRTELNGEYSDWVSIENICLEENTTISAPGVKLHTRTKGIEVDITEPVLRKSNLKEIYSQVEYSISYWTEGQARKTMLVDQSRVMLLDLTPEVQCCVEVQLLLNKRIKSLQSQPTCATSPISDDLNPGQIVLYLAGSTVVTFIAVLLIFGFVWTSYKGIRFMHPQAKLPEHFKQYLLERPNAFMDMQKSTQQSELYDDICVIVTQDNPAASQECKDLDVEKHLLLK